MDAPARSAKINQITNKGEDMSKFIKIPVEIEAEQYTEYGKLIKGMCSSRSCYTSGNDEPHVHTIHAHQIVNLALGDWIVPEPDGIHFYPVKNDIFITTYRPKD